MGQTPQTYFAPGYTRGSTSGGTAQDYDALVYDITVKQRVKGVTINSGQGTLARGTVLGIAAEGSIASSKVSGFAGGGSIGSLSFTPAAESGVYVVDCTSAALPATFSVTAPSGENLGTATAGTAYSAYGVGFTITASGTAFAVGDTFDVTVPVLTGQANIVNSANSDGSQYADCILCDTVVTGTGSAVVAEAYTAGSFNRQALIFGGTDTYATVVSGDSKTHEAHLRLNGIFLSDKIAYVQNPNV
jgi:hypothetical protein